MLTASKSGPMTLVTMSPATVNPVYLNPERYDSAFFSGHRFHLSPMSTEDSRHKNDLSFGKMSRPSGPVLWHLPCQPLRRRRQGCPLGCRMEVPAVPRHLQLLNLSDASGQISDRTNGERGTASWFRFGQALLGLVEGESRQEMRCGGEKQ